MKNKVLFWVFAAVFSLILLLFIIRAFSERQLDDISPGIPCEAELLQKADILYIIPKFENKSIAENKAWCSYILSFNKTLGMHGVYHTFNEFSEDRNEAYIQEGREIFKDCFGFYPEIFEPPQVAISKNSKELIKKHMKIKLYLHSLLHKVYHCEDTGKYSNKFIDSF